MFRLDQVRAEVVGICFHGVGTPGPWLDAAAEEYFISTNLFLAVLDEVMRHPAVDITVDDGYASDVDVVLPALSERGLTARFFPLAGELGRPGYLDVAGVKALAAAGMVVGSHGMRHRSWRGLDTSSRHEELTVARELLADAAGVLVSSAALPFGDYDRQVLAALRRHGYLQVFTSDRRRARAGAWLQPRYSVLRTDTVQIIRDAILAPPPLAERVRCAAAARVKAWR